MTSFSASKIFCHFSDYLPSQKLMSYYTGTFPRLLSHLNDNFTLEMFRQLQDVFPQIMLPVLSKNASKVLPCKAEVSSLQQSVLNVAECLQAVCDTLTYDRLLEPGNAVLICYVERVTSARLSIAHFSCCNNSAILSMKYPLGVLSSNTECNFSGCFSSFWADQAERGLCSSFNSHNFDGNV